MRRKSFVYGAAVLVAASLFNRILGFGYQILIIDLIGANGIGLFNMVYPIYVLAIVLATAGVPLAVSKYVAEEMANNNIKRAYLILKIALTFLIISGLVCTGLLYLGTPLIMKYVFTNPKVLKVFQVLIPGVFLVSVSSAFRGFFQGLLEMKPPAISQMCEQTIRVTIGLAAATYFLPQGIEAAAVGASLGVLAGELTGLITIIILFLYKNPTAKAIKMVPFANVPKILSGLFTLSIPVTMSRLIATIILSLEASLIPKRLVVAGFSIEQATTIYGQLTGMAVTVLVLPSVLTASLATTLVPAVSEAMASYNTTALRSRIVEALRLTLVVGLPSFVTFLILPCQITDLLFHCPEAGLSLKVLSVGGIFYYLQQTTNGILQGMGLAKLPLQNLIIASILELIGLYYLTGLPQLGITGAAWAVNISFIIVALMNLAYILPYINWEIDTKLVLWKPLFSSGLLGLVMYYSYKWLFHFSNSNTISTLLSLVLAFSCYFIALLACKAITVNDLVKIPYLGTKLSRWLRR